MNDPDFQIEGSPGAIITGITVVVIVFIVAAIFMSRNNSQDCIKTCGDNKILKCAWTEIVCINRVDK